MKSHTSRPPRARSCTGKKAYSRDDAESAAQYVASSTGALMGAYRCVHGCVLPDKRPAWHIGHTTVRKR